MTGASDPPRLDQADGKAWVELPFGPPGEPDAYQRYWRRFDAVFDWRGGMAPEDWLDPGEPTPSITFDFSGLHGSSYVAALDAVSAEAVRAFVDLVRPDEHLIVLDHQHPCYHFWPHQQVVAEPQHWPVTVWADGDYYAFVSTDFGFGTFGHPWEKTLCVFGAPLVRDLGETLRTWLPIKRERPGPSRRRQLRPAGVGPPG